MKTFFSLMALFAATAVSAERFEEDDMEALRLSITDDDVEMMMDLRRLAPHGGNNATNATTPAPTTPPPTTPPPTTPAPTTAPPTTPAPTQAPTTAPPTTAAPTTAAPTQAPTTAAATQAGSGTGGEGTTRAPPTVEPTITITTPTKVVEIPDAFATPEAAVAALDELLQGASGSTGPSLELSAAEEAAAITAIASLAAPAAGEAVVKVTRAVGLQTSVPVDIDAGSPIAVVKKMLSITLKIVIAKGLGCAVTNLMSFVVEISGRRQMRNRRSLAAKTASATYDVVIIEDTSSTTGLKLADIVNADGEVKAPVISAAQITAAGAEAIQVMKTAAGSNADTLALLTALEGSVQITGSAASSAGTVTTVETTAAAVAAIPALAKLQESQEEFKDLNAPVQTATSSGGASAKFAFSGLAAVAAIAVAMF